MPSRAMAWKMWSEHRLLEALPRTNFQDLFESVDSSNALRDSQSQPASRQNDSHAVYPNKITAGQRDPFAYSQISPR